MFDKCRYVRYSFTDNPVPNSSFPFPIYYPFGRHRVPSFYSDTTPGVDSTEVVHRLCNALVDKSFLYHLDINA